MINIRENTIRNFNKPYPKLSIKTTNRLYTFYFNVLGKDKGLKVYHDLSCFANFLLWSYNNNFNNDTYPIRKIYELGWIPSNIAFRKKDLFNTLLTPIKDNPPTPFRHVYTITYDRKGGSKIKTKYTAIVSKNGKNKILPLTDTAEESYMLYRAYVLKRVKLTNEEMYILRLREYMDELARNKC